MTATTFAASVSHWLRKNYAAASGPYVKRHHIQTGVGHNSVFAGQRWSSYIYPIMRNVIYASD